MAKVYINNQNDFESRLSAFMGICKKEGIMRECRDRAHFIPKNEIERYENKKRKEKINRKTMIENKRAK